MATIADQFMGPNFMLNDGNNMLRALIAQFDHIVLLANNETNNIEHIAAQFPDSTLFVFFNSAAILKQPFTRPALLCCRATPQRDRIYTSKETRASIRSLLPGPLIGEVAIFSPVPETPYDEQMPLDCDHVINFQKSFPDLYPSGSEPSTGFALATWLAHHCPNTQLHLIGFSGLAGTNLTILYAHDWIFEQTTLKALQAAGRLSLTLIDDAATPTSSYKRVTQFFPEITESDISTIRHNVLQERIISNEQRLGQLWRSSRWMILARDAFRSAKTCFKRRKS